MLQFNSVGQGFGVCLNPCNSNTEACFSNHTEYCLTERDGQNEQRKRRWIDRKEVKAIRGKQQDSTKQ